MPRMMMMGMRFSVMDGPRTPARVDRVVLRVAVEGVIPILFPCQPQRTNGAGVSVHGIRHCNLRRIFVFGGLDKARDGSGHARPDTINYYVGAAFRQSTMGLHDSTSHVDKVLVLCCVCT